jgi:hypothetical protein
LNTANDAYGPLHFAFARHDNENLMLVVSNFDPDKPLATTLNLPEAVVEQLGLSSGEYALQGLLEDHVSQLTINSDGATFAVALAPLSSAVLVLTR